MSNPGPRELLAQADNEKRIAQWAESLRCSIRLGRPIKVSEMHQCGPFGRRGKYLYELDDRMPSAAIDGLYRALALVAKEAHGRATDLEARVIAKENADA